MSYITDVIVYDAHAADVERLNDWLRENDPRKQQLVNVRPVLEDAAGGTKWFVSDTWAAAFNYLPDEFEEKLRDPASWRAPVGVVIGSENEPYCEAFAFTWGDADGEIVRVEP